MRTICPRHWQPVNAMLFTLLVLLLGCIPVMSAAAAPKEKSAKHMFLIGDEYNIEDRDGLGEESIVLESSEELVDAPDLSFEYDDYFGDAEESHQTDEDLDPGSWSHILDQLSMADSRSGEYVIGVRKMVEAVNEEDPDMMKEAVGHLLSEAEHGNAHAQSTLAFLHGTGCGMERSSSKAFLLHHFAAEGGNYQSKMALAYSYYRQQMYKEAIILYAELAANTMAGFLSSKEASVMEHVRLNYGLEESKEVLKKFRGEEDDDFQFLEYKAHKGHPRAMYQLGVFYYFGLRGVRRDHSKALSWLLKAAEKNEVQPMELLGEMYVHGYGVERNYSKALEWFKAAAYKNQFSALNGIGYLYVKGQGVEGKNYTKAKELFEQAANAENADGFYNLGILYLKGLGVEKNVVAAGEYLKRAGARGHPKALYHLAKMLHKGLAGMKKDSAMAATLYKEMTERGPWGTLLRQALEYYLKGNIGKALLLYSRAAELGYEVGQSNAAWILEKYHGGICLSSSGVCTGTERQERAHNLWRFSSEQGNEHASLLLGDAYYYGRGASQDLERAAEAYLRAQEKRNSQAMFNLGYMYERGLGLPLDLHLAKRYYDQALQSEPAAFLPVTLALTGLWLRQHYTNSFVVRFLDFLPEAIPKMGNWLRAFPVDGGDATLATLFVSLLTVLYFRQRQRQMVTPAPQ